MAGTGATAVRTRSWRVLVLVVTVVAFIVAGCTGSSNAAKPSASAAKSKGASGGSSLQGAAFDRIPGIVDKVQPSVVTVRTRKGLGSGVIYRSSGVIVTNRHVVARSEQENAPVFHKVVVVFATGKKTTGRVVGSDYRTDLAVVKIRKTGLNSVPFQTHLPEVGALAVAMGSPLGFNDSVTAGIISGLNRSFPVSDTKRPLVNLIQTDAPISPGNSGGALVNENAQVIGITELYLPPGKTGAVSIGFVIPSSTVVDVVDQILKTGHVKHATLGS